MPSAVLPAGVLPDIPDASLIGHRSVKRKYELVGRDGAVIRTLDGVKGATLQQVANSTLKRGGSADVTDVGQDVDWLTARIKASYEIEGYGSWGLGVFLPSVPAETWSGGVRRWVVEMLDVATVLAEANTDNGYSLDAGANVTNAVKVLIAAAGETAIAITDSDKTLTTSRVWESDKSYLQIVNELLQDGIGYFSLTSDGDGRLVGEPYLGPAQRPISWEFVDGDECIYRDTFTHEQDFYKVPNAQQARTRGTGDVPGITRTAYNDDPDSEFSRDRRERQINGEIVEVDATDEDALFTIARRVLLDRTSPTSTIVIDALPLDLTVNQAVRFQSTPAGIDGRFVITRIEYGDSDTSLARYTLRRVVDL